MLIPLGLVEAPRRRTPWISLFIGISCTVLMLVDDLRMDERLQPVQISAEFRAYWKAHPYLDLPSAAVPHVTSDEIDQMWELAKPIWADGKIPQQGQLQKEFEHLESLLQSDMKDPWHEEYGLTPSRGLQQPGWITAMFLHGGWGHLVLNMIFFSMVGPVLEELLTPFVFLGFYLLGGLVAAVAQYFMDNHSSVPMIGASGAVAACMGAFTVRFAAAHMRLLWFRGFFPPRVVEWPTWIWSLLWVGEQGLMFYLAGAVAGGIAVMAHLGGFAFGVGIAVLLKVTGFGERLETSRPPVDAAPNPHAPVDPLERADKLLAEQNALAAFDGYREILRRDPLSLPAQWGMARCLFLLGEPDEASRVFDAVLARWVAAGTMAFIDPAVALVGRELLVSELRPAHAGLIARALEEIDPQKARQAHAHAVRDSEAFASA